MPVYNRLPIAFEKGEGPWLISTKGERFLDAISGIAVCGLGHAHPIVNKTIETQAKKLIHTSNLYQIPLQQTLAEELAKISGLSECFFCNSGAEANEAAIKLARLYGHQKGIQNPHIIVMENAFHGRTLATLSASGSRKVQAGFEPLVSGFTRAPLNDIDALKNIANNNPQVVAILLEPIQGEGGIHSASTEYLSQIRTLCDAENWLLMLDEVQSGNGRTGKYFAYQHTYIKPDVVTTAKGLGNGIPIGVCITGVKAQNVMQAGNHGSTFGGNPFACAVGSSVIETLFNEGLIERAAKLGDRMLDQLHEELERTDYTHSIRGKGLMIGIELDKPCSELVSLAKAKGLLINVTAERVVRLLPPLILSDQEADNMITLLCKLIKTFMGDDRRKPRPS